MYGSIIMLSISETVLCTVRGKKSSLLFFLIHDWNFSPHRNKNLALGLASKARLPLQRENAKISVENVEELSTPYIFVHVLWL